MSGPISVYLERRGSRAEDVRRYAVTVGLSLLLHLLLLLLTFQWVGRAAEAPVEDQEIFVPLSLEQPEEASPPPEPVPAPAPSQEPPAEQVPAAESEREVLEGSTPGETEEQLWRPVGPDLPIKSPGEANETGDIFGTDPIPEPAPPEPAPVLPDPPEETEEAEQPKPPDPVEEQAEAPDEPDELPVDDSPPEEPGEEGGPDRGPAVVAPEPLETETEGPETSEGAPPPSREPEELPPPEPPRRQRPRRAPDLDTRLPGGGWGGNLQFDSESEYDFDEYRHKVYWAIREAWLRELWNARARFGRDQAMLRLPSLDGQVRIHFVIQRDGNVGQLKVLSPSPMPTLDAASQAAILAAVLPQLPDDFPRDAEGATFIFRIFGFPSSQALSNRLEQSRRYGEF